MPLSRRYSPEVAPNESSVFGLDFSPIIPPGIGIVYGTLDIKTNTNPPVEANADWSVGAVTVQDRTLYATLSPTRPGTDYILTWTAVDTAGNAWPRSALALVSPTS